MRASSIPSIVIASVIVFLGAFSAFIYSQRRAREPALLSFAATCFLFSIYAITSAGLYSSESYVQGREWQRWGVVGLVLSSIALLKFVGDFTGRLVSRKAFWFFAAAMAAGAALDLFSHSDWVWRENEPSVKHVGCPFGMDFVYNEMEVGPLVGIQFALGFAIIVYSIYVAARFYRSGERRRGAFLLAALTALFASALNDALVNLDVYVFYYTTEYAYMTIVFLMVYSMAQESVAAAEIIRERAALEERLREVEKMEAIGRLAGGVAHDLNNMLTPIIGYVDIARRRKKTNEELMEYLSRIGDAAEHSRRLTWQLLAFSRKQPLNMRVLDLNQVVRDSEQMLRSLVREDVTMALDLAEDVGRVRADATQLQQILVNLVINARDAMPAGGALRIATRLQGVKDGRDGLAILSVRDSGHGMDSATASRAFEPFFTTKERGRGTGLGLATVYGIVSQHDGTVEVDTAPGAGTEIRVCLRTVDEPLSVSSVTPVHAIEEITRRRILVVEDEETVRAWVCEVLRGHGHDVVEAKSPDGAMEMARRGDLGKIDLLLTDVVMPGMNGFQLHERLSSLLGELKVLYISGYSGDVIAERGLSEASLAILHKPFSVAKLIAAVGEILSMP